MPVVSTRPASPADLARPDTLSRTVHGRSCVWIVIAFPQRYPDLGAAVETALAAGGSAVLWGAQMRYEIAYFPPIGRVCYAVEGRLP